MNKQQITTKQLALCSVLLTLMLVLGWVESLFPPLLGVPGIKLGLSNGVLIFAVYMLSLPTAWVLMLLKVVLSSLFLGGVAALPYAQPGDDAREQNHDGKRAADGGKGDFTAVSPDDEGVHKVIKLLEQIARHQRQRKTEQSAENRTMGQVNIHNKGILLSLHRIV